MEKNPEEIWKEVWDNIPVMRKAVAKGLKRDLAAFVHDDKRIRNERDSLGNALKFLQKKWTLDLIYIIRIKGKSFFNDIRRAIPEINSRTLTTRLKEFADLGIVNRKIESTQPIRVSYELTDLGTGVYELVLPLLFFYSREQWNMKNKIDKKTDESFSST
ncbi:winged helix-turn-helix transcriptional regulator [Candidatus Lokiarchaeum ossiferum]|uniref:winged helix-turn-helix transcriptional regulator n=1 Tax=Candidatus Lokiarchaeum ossiferum TaxID=2951803 RepID=UPI00352E00A8